MAHFAKLDKDNRVLEVHVVSNDALDPQNEEASGIAFLTEWSGGHTKWKQTSYNGRIRKNYAEPDGFYYEEFDAFIPKQHHKSWKLNYTTFQFDPPIPRPIDDGEFYKWDEYNQQWVDIRTL